jgi:dTDP-4-amino-4,6-dideoxygalactose transaminase
VGHAACFSFYPGKNLGALGDGGLVLSSDSDAVAAVRHLRDHGRSTKYEHDEVGWCSRLDAMQAAFLSVKLRHLPDWTASRRRLAERYWAGLPEVLVPWEEGAVHHLLVARVPDGKREHVQTMLGDVGIESGVHYPIALSDQPAMRPWTQPCPAAEKAAAEVLSLPMDPLMSDDDVDAVCERFRAIL